MEFYFSWKKKYYISRCTEEIADLISSIIGDFKNNTSNDAQTSIYTRLGSAKPLAHEQHQDCAPQDSAGCVFEDILNQFADMGSELLAAPLSALLCCFASWLQFGHT